MPGFDMHIHTTASDGNFSVKEIIEKAIEIKLEGIALTDHDTIDGLEEGVAWGEKHKFPVIPGIELSTEFNDQEIHILGYFIDYRLSWVKEKLAELQDARVTRIVKIVDNLKKLGYDVNVDEVFLQAGQGAVGRPHVAYVLQQKGYVSHLQDAFHRLIGKDCPAYVPRYKMTPLEALDFITKAGGIPVLAHPGLSKADPLICPLWEKGLKGLEVYHPDHNTYDEAKYLDVAKEYKLLVTGGSDFHGPLGGDRSALGSKYVPATIWQDMINLIKR
jgi:predicted metal-dependent phosphoesterase TrpH